MKKTYVKPEAMKVSFQYTKVIANSSCSTHKAKDIDNNGRILGETGDLGTCGCINPDNPPTYTLI